jgi:ActR/RegA family two-component response regulator
MMGGMGSPGTVAVVTDDLMFASQLSTTMRRAGGSAVLLSGEAVPDVAVVFVDLNTAVESRLAMIARLHNERPDLEIVGFSHHGDLALRRRARASGATRVVNNGSIQAVALRRSGVGATGAP